MRFDLWGSITCGQNLDVKELTRRIPDEGSPRRDDTISAHRHGLDHDRAIEMARARSDVTWGLWKSPLWPPHWNKKKAEGKWKDYPDYGLAKTGFIALQDHGHKAYFKNIFIKVL